MKHRESHPWIRFQVRIPQDDYILWLDLGELASKCEHLAGVPLRPDVADHLHRVYLAKGALATTAIEGNTLSEKQVLDQVEGKLELPPSQKYLQQEVQNIIDACNQEVRNHHQDSTSRPSLCVDLIKSYNAAVLKGLEVGEGVVPGWYRAHSVVVGNVYRGAPPEECEYLMDRLCQWLNSSDFNPPNEELAIPFAIIKAIVAHVYLAWIHPFGDGNGRTARLLEFHILYSNGVPLPAAHLLSDHYNLTRTQYYRELDRASKSGGDLVPFLRYAIQGFLDGIRQQLAAIRVQQLAVAWENYVHDRFRQFKSSPTQKRRRDLVLELSKRDWVPTSEIDKLTPDQAAEYAKAGDRMIQRDLNALFKMELIARQHGKVRARTERIKAFLPRRVS